MKWLRSSRRWVTVLMSGALLFGVVGLSVLSVSALARTLGELVHLSAAVGERVTPRIAAEPPPPRPARMELVSSELRTARLTTALDSVGVAAAGRAPSSATEPSERRVAIDAPPSEPPDESAPDESAPDESAPSLTWIEPLPDAPRCDDVYVYIVSDFVAGDSAVASVAYGQRSRARSKRIGARVGPWTIIDIGHNSHALSPSVWLADAAGEVCQAKVFDSNPHREKQYKKKKPKKKKPKKKKRKKRRR